MHAYIHTVHTYMISDSLHKSLTQPTHLGDAADGAFEALETFDPNEDNTLPMFTTAFPVFLRTWLSWGDVVVVTENEFSPVSCITCGWIRWMEVSYVSQRIVVVCCCCCCCVALFLKQCFSSSSGKKQ